MKIACYFLFSTVLNKLCHITDVYICYMRSFPVAQMVEHGASNAKIMGSIPRESKS